MFVFLETNFYCSYNAKSQLLMGRLCSKSPFCGDEILTEKGQECSFHVTLSIISMGSSSVSQTPFRRCR